MQEATVRTRHGITDWFQIGKGVQQGCILSRCLFNFYAEYIMWMNHKLDESQAGIKTAERNINNLRYADDTTLMAECEEELNSLLMKVKEESEKVGLKLNIQNTKIMTSRPITFWQIEGTKWKQWQIFFSWAPKSLWIAIRQTLKSMPETSHKKGATSDTYIHIFGEVKKYHFFITHAWIYSHVSILCWHRSVYSKLWLFQ